MLNSGTVVFIKAISIKLSGVTHCWLLTMNKHYPVIHHMLKWNCNSRKSGKYVLKWKSCVNNRQFKQLKCSPRNNSWPLAIFWPISTFGWLKSILVGQIYCIFSMGRPSIMHKMFYLQKNGQPISDSYLYHWNDDAVFERIFQVCMCFIKNDNHQLGT